MRQINFAVLIFVIAVALFSSGCVSVDNESGKQSVLGQKEELLYSAAPGAVGGAEKEVFVEMFKFRGNTKCYSCVRLGELSDMVVEKHFKDEVASGKLVYKEINAQDSENALVTREYQISAISLQIGTTINGVKKRENLLNVWYYLEDEAGFENYLKPILEKRLNGELN